MKGNNLKLFDRAEECKTSTAIIVSGRNFSYRDLLAASCRVAGSLLDGRSDLKGERIAFMVPPGFDYVAVQWGIWRAGGVAVPLGLQYPDPEIEYTVTHSGTTTVITVREFEESLTLICQTQRSRLRLVQEILSGPSVEMPILESGRPAMILYTSGTTSRPKGVLMTHENIQAQVTSLIEAWEWTAKDHILLVLPLHHIHGIINILTCSLMAGAKCDMQIGFNCESAWKQLAAGNLTLFMAVPTIYSKLIDGWENAQSDVKINLSQGASRLRLMVSGSSALPVAVLERWKAITGHVLLERYGMTEIGMALSNPLHGERRPGYVGTELPEVEVRCVDEKGSRVGPGKEGEIEVRGQTVFREYWENPEATKSAFRGDWFRTGDIAIMDQGSYRILGRKNVDIIKTGGYKVSALEIEEVLREHLEILDCAVVGIDDLEWGEKVLAVIELRRPGVIDLRNLREWAKERLAVQKVPRELFEIEKLPRNALGKINKQELRARFEER